MVSYDVLIEGQAGGHILDVATGQGHFARWMAESLSGVCSVTGIDDSEKGFEQAREALPDATLLRMDAVRMTFADCCFDTVGISNSVHHLADRFTAMGEIRRVLKPGGILLLSEMYRDVEADTQQTHVLLHHWWAEVDRSLGIPHFRTLTRGELPDLVRACGLVVELALDWKNLEADPKDPETLAEFDKIIDMYLDRADQTANREVFRRRGEELRRRLHEVGFHPATLLLLRARKP